MSQILGIDTSVHTGLFDYAKAKAKGVKWAVAKATDVGSATNAGFIDAQFDNSYHNAKSQGIIFGAYHWMDARRSGEYQANYYLDNIYRKYKIDLPPVLDWEESEGIAKGKAFIEQTRIWLNIVESATGRVPILYTARWYTDNFYSVDMAWMNRYPLWVAHYANVSYPLLPKAWTDYMMWQYASNASYPHYTKSGGNGYDWGSQQKGLDMNWFKGTMDDLLRLAKGEAPIVVDPPPDPDPVIPLFKGKVTATLGLRIRNKPAISGLQVGSLLYEQVVEIFAEKNGWYKISPTEEKWSLGEYIEKIDENPSPELKPIGKVKITKADQWINIRSNPGTIYPIVGTIPIGSVVDYYVETSQWLRVSATESKWIYKPLTDPYQEPVVVDPNPIVEAGEQVEYLYLPFNEEMGFPITQYFGTNPSWYPSSKGHNGIDWGIPPGNEIFAMRRGQVIRADYNPDGYGLSVWIQHFDSEGRRAGVTIYGHMRRVDVRIGDTVEAKQRVGLSDGELSNPYRGFSTGAHLHAELRLDKQAPQVPGGYKYNAIDIIPLLRSWDLQEGKLLEPKGQGKVTASTLLIRTGAGINFRPYGYEYLTNGAEVTIYDEKNGFYRISPNLNKWSTASWIEKI